MMGLGHRTSFFEFMRYILHNVVKLMKYKKALFFATWEGSDMWVRVEFQGFSRCWETSNSIRELVFSDSLKHAFILCLTVMRVEGNKFSDNKDDMWLAPLGFDIYDLDHGKYIYIYTRIYMPHILFLCTMTYIMILGSWLPQNQWKNTFDSSDFSASLPWVFAGLKRPSPPRVCCGFGVRTSEQPWR